MPANNSLIPARFCAGSVEVAVDCAFALSGTAGVVTVALAALVDVATVEFSDVTANIDISGVDAVTVEKMVWVDCTATG